MAHVKFSQLSFLAITLMMGAAHAETSTTEPMVEGGKCTPKDAQGNALLDKSGKPMVGMYQKKVQTADSSKAEPVAPLPEKLSIAGPEPILAQEDILILDPNMDESLNKSVTFSDLKAIPSEDQKTFHLEGEVKILGSNPQKLELNLHIQHFSDAEFKTGVSESMYTVGSLAGGESMHFKSEPQDLSPKGRFVKIVIK